ncbi:oligoribonuclease [Corynebacterium mendelii]
MTGLDPDTHVIVEIAALVTDAHLNVLGEGVDLVVHATDEELSRMNDFVTDMHTTSGLIDEIKASTVSLAEAEDIVVDMIRSHCPDEHLPPLAGNSIATDRAFIKAHMKKLNSVLHYRMIDVSSIKELTRRWYPKAYYGQPGKGMAHRALADIIESIRELDYYRRSVFLPEQGLSPDGIERATTESINRFAPLLEGQPNFNQS